ARPVEPRRGCGRGRLGVDELTLAEPLAPTRPHRRKPLAQPRTDLKLGAVALPVVEADGLDPGEALERPGEAHGRILPTGKQHERVFGAGSAHCTTPPSWLASATISAISSALSSKSKISKFSDSRSSLLVRGMTTNCCCTRKRRLTCAALLPCALPMRASMASFLALPRAIGL